MYINGQAVAPTQGIIPTGTLNITENGTYDVSDYSNIVVDVQPPAPPYTELDYLQSTGTQYIDTGIAAQQPNISIEMKAQFVVANNRTSMFGSNRGAAYNSYIMTTWESNNLYFYTGNSGYNYATFADISNQHIYKTVDNLLYVDGTLLVTGNATSYSNGQPIFLFGANMNGAFSQGASAKIWYCKIKIGDVLVRDLIPVLYEGVPCMYDKISETYFYNEGSGDFLYGEVTN